MDNQNITTRLAGAEAVRPERIRYKPLRGLYAGQNHVRAFAAALAPLGGSSLLFPRALANALDERATRREPAVVNQDARWFFGRTAIVWANPRHLTWRLHDAVHDGRRNIRLSTWFIDAQDWTDVVTPVRRLAEHRETLELVKFGRRYPEMPSFQRMLSRAREGRPAPRYGSRLDSEEKIHDYFRYFLRLIDSIRDSGFRPLEEMPRSWLPSGFGVRGVHAFHQREIGAAVDAHGRLLRFLGGRHRTAIAQALKLPAVPVEIRFVHADWLAAEAARTGLDPARALQAWAKRVSVPGSHRS